MRDRSTASARPGRGPGRGREGGPAAAAGSSARRAWVGSRGAVNRPASGSGTASRVRRPRPRNALERVGPLDELDAGAGDEVAHARRSRGPHRARPPTASRAATVTPRPATSSPRRLDLARVHAGPDADAELGQRRPRRERGSQRPGRAVEHREHTVAGRLHPAARPDCSTASRTIRSWRSSRALHRASPMVAFRSVDPTMSVNSVVARHAFARRPARSAARRRTSLDEAPRSGRAPGRRRSTGRDRPLELHDRRAAGSRSARNSASSRSDLRIVAAVQHERRDVDGRQDVADVDLRVHLDHRAGRSRTGRGAGPPLPPVGHRIVGVGAHALHVRPEAPLRPGSRAAVGAHG